MMWAQLRSTLEMIRFSHTLFAMPFALLAAIMAWNVPVAGGGDSSLSNTSAPIGFRWIHLIGIVLCMVFARSAAMAFNRLVDRRIDADNPRTANRHLVTGQLSVAAAWRFTIVSSVLFVASTLLFLPNRWPICLSGPVLGVLLLYSYTKRITWMAHFWLGLALMLAPVSAWIAIRGELLTGTPSDILPAFIIGLAVLAWVSGFDIIYACQDADFDRDAKLNSVPAKFGIGGALRIAAACHAAMIGLLAALPFVCTQLPFGWVYATGVIAVALLLIYEHAIVRPHDLKRVNTAFFQVNVIVSVGLLIIVTIDLFH